MIVATLETDHGNATLSDNGRWESSEGDLRQWLNARFPAVLFPPSPSEGVPRQRQAEAAAEQLGARLAFQVEPDSVDGRVY